MTREAYITELRVAGIDYALAVEDFNDTMQRYVLGSSEPTMYKVVLAEFRRASDRYKVALDDYLEYLTGHRRSTARPSVPIRRKPRARSQEQVGLRKS